MSRNLDTDYSRFKKEITKSSNNIIVIDSSNESFFQKSHQATYVIALFIEKLSNISVEENKIVFISEILSDFLTFYKLTLLGFYFPSMISIRRSIENFYNHVYFYDHSVEYFHLNHGKNDYTPIEEVKKYLLAHPVFIENSDGVIKEFCDYIFTEYHELCRIVHSKGSAYMNLASCLQELVTESDFKGTMKKVIKLQVYFIYILYKFHRNLKFSRTEKDLIVEIIPRNKRSSFNE